MRCDKCGKRFDDDWFPEEGWPKYDILQKCGVTSHISRIYLCDECSKKLKKWLEEDDETSRCR